MAKTTSAESTPARRKKSQTFSAEERAAMRERAKELKAAKNREDGERDVLAKIAEMRESDRVMAERVHAIVKESAPDLTPRTWYGMPAYSNGDKIVCFFRDAAKFKERYAMLGFNDSAQLDDGAMWPVAFALTKLTAADEKRIAALVKKSVS
jgi:uncharacterized protein YdhG (YjbR/CyaY superfamily)